MSTVRAWLPGPLDRAMQRAIERLAQTEGVVHVALMPDAHLAEEVCVGTVVATEDHLFPDAVGGDVGCGMCAFALDADADRIDERAASALFDALERSVPILKHRSRALPAWPAELSPEQLADPALARTAEREGLRQLGTLGRGNHFVELQRDDAGRLFAMIHSGSRAMGGAIRARALARCERAATGLAFLRDGSDEGRAYLAAVEWGRAYARASRRRIAEALALALERELGAEVDDSTWIEVDHNHVARETHLGRALWVHRKGAMHAPEGALGVIPGSMGSASYHVEGRGCEEALASCSHGAGRAMSRSEARRRVGLDRLLRETRGVWIDHRLAHRLREEAPSAYKDVGAVMKAQRELTRIVRRLLPVLVYKGA